MAYCSLYRVIENETEHYNADIVLFISFLIKTLQSIVRIGSVHNFDALGLGLGKLLILCKAHHQVFMWRQLFMNARENKALFSLNELF